VYGALVVASYAYRARTVLEQKVAALAAWLARRPAVVEAALELMRREGLETTEAGYARACRLTMSSRRSIKNAAESLLNPAGRRRA
jgi:AmiR/NasT family two-component response regulator